MVSIIKIIQRVSPTLAVVLEYHLKNILNREPEEVLLENPAIFYQTLVKISGGDELTVDLMLEAVVRELNRRHGSYVNPYELVSALRRGDSQTVKRLLTMLNGAMGSEEEG